MIEYTHYYEFNHKPTTNNQKTYICVNKLIFMKNLLLLSIIFLFMTGCKKEEKEAPNVLILEGKWLTWDEGHNSDVVVKSTEWLEFGNNRYESVFNEKWVALPDCTVIYKISRVVTADYSVHKPFIRFTNMKSDTNGVEEYSGKSMYRLYTIGFNEVTLTNAEAWQQLAGTNGQLKDGLFYQLDSSYYLNDSISYHHHKIKFSGDFVNFYHINSSSREMPDNNDNWESSSYKADVTDSTFILGNKVYYQFIDGLLITYRHAGYYDFQESYTAYEYYLWLMGQ